MYVSDTTDAFYLFFHAGHEPVTVTLPGEPWSSGYRIVGPHRHARRTAPALARLPGTPRARSSRAAPSSVMEATVARRARWTPSDADGAPCSSVRRDAAQRDQAQATVQPTATRTPPAPAPAPEPTRIPVDLSATTTVVRGIGRIPVLKVEPVIEGGAYPAKAVVGELVPIRAKVFREGHDAVNASVILTDPSAARPATT